KKVLLIDIDPQANLSQSVGIEEPVQSIYESLCAEQSLSIQKISTNLDIVPSELGLSEAANILRTEMNGFFKLRKILQPTKQNYDYIFVDCPPSLEVLTINALIACDEALIVAKAETLSIKGLEATLRAIEEAQENLNPLVKLLGVLITQIDGRTSIHREIAQALKKSENIHVFDTVIRLNIALTEATHFRKNIFEYQPKSNGAEDYMNLAKEILK
ncbi:MAG: ParA family protein, partial [Bacteroidetes bacterium]